MLTNNVADRLSSYSVYRIRGDREQDDNGFFELVMYLDAVKKSRCNDTTLIWTDCFDLVQLFQTQAIFHRILIFQSISEYTVITPILDEPFCGFRGELCNHTLAYVTIAIGSVAVVLAIVAGIVYRQKYVAR